MSQDLPDPEDLPEPLRLRQLRWLVNLLTLTLIVGFAVIVVTFVMRMRAPSPSLDLPATISLPEGETAGAVTFGTGWIAIVTRDAAGVETIRIFDAETGRARQSVKVQ